MIKVIGLRGYEYEVEPKQFPDGTLKLNLPTITPSQIAWYYENDAELFTLMCVRKFYHNHSISLFMPYIPHARMDRVKNEDEVFTLKYFCEIINSLNFTKVYVYDPHSNVSKALLNNVEEISIFDIVMLAFNDATNDCGEQPVFFFPDEGAMKRYSSMFNVPYAFGMKHRNWEDGKILDLDIINADVIKCKNVFIVDDICSKGGTFYHSAKALKTAGAKNVYLYITHLESTVLAGDFSILSSYCVREVKEIGAYLSLPDRFINKIPSDGMCGKTDENNLGFTYDVLDAYILDEVYPDYETLENIKERYNHNLHKVHAVNLPSPRVKTRHWEGEPYEESVWEF